MVTLDGEDYLHPLKDPPVNGHVGGGIYHALIGNCAVKAKAEVIYTWNRKHFEPLVAEIASRLKTP